MDVLVILNIPNSVRRQCHIFAKLAQGLTAGHQSGNAARIAWQFGGF